MLDGLREGHQNENKSSVSSTFHCSGSATSHVYENCEFFFVCVAMNGRELDTKADLHSIIEDHYHLLLLLVLLFHHHHHAFHKNWIWLGSEDADFSFYVSVDNSLATYGFSSIDGLCDDRVGGGEAVRKMKGMMNVTLT